MRKKRREFRSGARWFAVRVLRWLFYLARLRQSLCRSRLRHKKRAKSKIRGCNGKGESLAAAAWPPFSLPPPVCRRMRVLSLALLLLCFARGLASSRLASSSLFLAKRPCLSLPSSSLQRWPRLETKEWLQTRFSSPPSLSLSRSLRAVGGGSLLRQRRCPLSFFFFPLLFLNPSFPPLRPSLYPKTKKTNN